MSTPERYRAVRQDGTPVDLDNVGGVTPTQLADAVAPKANQADVDAALASVVSMSALAADPDQIVATVTAFDPVTGVGTAGTVRWPDGATGSYTATTDSFAVKSYVVTHVLGGTTTTYTQPNLTRDSAGRVTARPQIVVT